MMPLCGDECLPAVDTVNKGLSLRQVKPDHEIDRVDETSDVLYELEANDPVVVFDGFQTRLQWIPKAANPPETDFVKAFCRGMGQTFSRAFAELVLKPCRIRFKDFVKMSDSPDFFWPIPQYLADFLVV